jgi:hypothetical protein
MSRWRNFWRLSWGDRWLLMEAAAWLGAARLAISVLPFRRIAPHLGVAGRETSGADDPDTFERARLIGWALRTASRHTPWESACLAQGIAGKLMLSVRRMASTLYLGVELDGEGEEGMSAHAWLRCGTMILTGANDRHRFKIVATFGTSSPEEQMPGDT